MKNRFLTAILTLLTLSTVPAFAIQANPQDVKDALAKSDIFLNTKKKLEASNTYQMELMTLLDIDESKLGKCSGMDASQSAQALIVVFELANNKSARALFMTDGNLQRFELCQQPLISN